jgi:hypothetical protein
VHIVLAEILAPVQTARMPTPAIVVLSITVLGSVFFITNQVMDLLRRNRNLKHWERDEPLEGRAGEWD